VPTLLKLFFLSKKCVWKGICWEDLLSQSGWEEWVARPTVNVQSRFTSRNELQLKQVITKKDAKKYSLLNFQTIIWTSLYLLYLFNRITLFLVILYFIWLVNYTFWHAILWCARRIAKPEGREIGTMRRRLFVITATLGDPTLKHKKMPSVIFWFGWCITGRGKTIGVIGQWPKES